MFPTLRKRIGATLLDQIDLALELSTLGAYGLGDDRRPLALDQASAAGGEPWGAAEAARAGHDVAGAGAPGAVTSTLPRRRDRCDRGPRSRAPRARA